MFKGLIHYLRSNIITGILVLAPIGAVLWIVAWLWNILIALTDLLPSELNPRVFFDPEHPIGVAALDFLVTLAVLTVILIFVASVGLISRNFIGRKLLSLFSHIMARVPVLSTVYSTLEQLLKTFASGQAKNFRKVVLVEYPRKGLFTLALVTGERDTHPQTGAKERYLNIYVPTTPNPTSGFYLTVAHEDVREINMTVEEALKEIISMGIVHKNG